jgi:hypothetical protein
MQTTKEMEETTATLVEEVMMLDMIDIPIPNLCSLPKEYVRINMIDINAVLQVQSRTFDADLYHYDYPSMNNKELLIYQSYALYKCAQTHQELFYYWKQHILFTLITTGYKDLTSEDLEQFLSIDTFCCNPKCNQHEDFFGNDLFKCTHVCSCCNLMRYCSSYCKKQAKLVYPDILDKDDMEMLELI